MRAFESVVEQIMSALLKPVWNLSCCSTWVYFGQYCDDGAEKALLIAYLDIILIKLIVRDVFSLVIKYLAGVPGPSRPAGWCIHPDTEMEAANIHRVVWPSFSTWCLPERILDSQLNGMKSSQMIPLTCCTSSARTPTLV